VYKADFKLTLPNRFDPENIASNDANVVWVATSAGKVPPPLLPPSGYGPSTFLPMAINLKVPVNAVILYE